MNLLASIAYAAGAAPQGQAGGEAQNPLFALLPFVAIIGVIYFLMIRPQKMQQQKHAEMIQGLKKNDEVITQGGIHATIVNVKENTFTLRVDDNARIEIGKSFILGKKKKS
jgi:preprotein translocase subunit YajC